MFYFYFNLSEHWFFEFYSNLLNLLGFTIYLASSWVLEINEGVLIANRFEISRTESELIQHRNFFGKNFSPKPSMAPLFFQMLIASFQWELNSDSFKLRIACQNEVEIAY